MRRHWYNPVEKEWEFGEIPTTDEEALSFLEGSADAEPCLEVYREWRFELGTSVLVALLRVSALAREVEAERRRGDESAGPPVS